jgi:hypothetical protein
MESKRLHTDTIGWAGSINASLAFTNYGKEVFAANGNAHVQYQSKKSLYLLLGSYGFLKGAEQSLINNAFLHFRYNYKLGKIVRLEAFTQLQQNAIVKIQSRFLVGAGPRFKIVGTQKVHLYAASLVMYEIEKETGKQQEIKDWRSSNYISLSYLINEQTELVTTTYYQPVFVDAKDYRILNQSTIKIKAGKKVSVNLNLSYQFDSSPAQGVTKDTYSYSTGIGWNL